MTNQLLRNELIKKLQISKQILSSKVKKLKNSYPMTTEEAVYVLAQQNGIILDKFLSPEEIVNIRGIINHLDFSTKPVNVKANYKPNIPTEKEKLRIVKIADEFSFADPILSNTTINEAKEMASVYPLLYLLENSFREFIDRKMNTLYGTDWWASHAPKGLRETVVKRMSDEQKNSWHQKRGSREIDYLDLPQLVPLARSIENDIVPDIIPSVEWFNQLIEELYPSRCVLCHMNPLDKDSVTSIKLRFKQWQKQISAKSNLL